MISIEPRSGRTRPEPTPYWAKLGQKYHRVLGDAPAGPVPGWWFVENGRASVMASEAIVKDEQAALSLAGLHWVEQAVIAGIDRAMARRVYARHVGDIYSADTLLRVMTEAVALARIEPSSPAFRDKLFFRPSMSADTLVEKEATGRKNNALSIASGSRSRPSILLPGGIPLFRRKRRVYVHAYTTFKGFDAEGVWLVRDCASDGIWSDLPDASREPRSVTASRVGQLPQPVSAAEVSGALAGVLPKTLEIVQEVQDCAASKQVSLRPLPTLITRIAWALIATRGASEGWPCEDFIRP